MNLTGKVSLITGGAGGFGRVFSESLLKKGAKVCLADLNQAKGEATVKELVEKFGHGTAIFVKCDITSKQDFANAFRKTKSEFGRIDIVCNNAGIADERQWRKTIDINLSAVIQGTLLGIEYLRKDKGGNGGLVINIASTAGLVPVAFLPAYAASKAGVVWYTRSWSESASNKQTGIRFCALCPSFADTDIIKAEDDAVFDPRRYQKVIDRIGIMKPEVVADAFMELVEDEHNNGSVLCVTKHHGKQYIPPPPKL